MQRPLSKLIILLLIIGLSQIVFALFNDSNNSQENVFGAGNLDIFISPENLGEMELDQLVNFYVANEGSLPYQYQLEITTEDTDFCNGLTFTTSTTTVSELLDTWQLEINDSFNTPLGQTCNFNLIVEAWQTSQENFSPTFGFSDVEEIIGSVLSGTGIMEYVKVTNPNGGEVWWVGRSHEIEWTAACPNANEDDLKIDLYYSNDSGQTWGLIIEGIENSGWYQFRVPLFLENFTYYVPSHTARVKVVAYDPNNPLTQCEDISDEDFCPPIDFHLLTDEERAWLKAMGLPYLDEKNMSFDPVFQPTVKDADFSFYEPAATTTATSTPEITPTLIEDEVGAPTPPEADVGVLETQSATEEIGPDENSQDTVPERKVEETNSKEPTSSPGESS